MLVCVNRRDPGHPLPCCGYERGMSVYDTLQELVLRHGLARSVLVTRTLCLSACQHGPTALVYPEQVWYGGLTAARARRIFHEHLLGGAAVEAFMLRTGEEGPKVAVDPVCGMEIDEATAAEMGVETLDYGGTTYYFCCPPCRRRFEAEPERYLARRPGDAGHEGHGGADA